MTSGVLLTDYDAVIASVGWLYNQLAVVPGDAAASPLFDKINQESPMFGGRMPLRGAVLPDAAIETIGRWIDNGALPSKSMSRGDFDRNEVTRHGGASGAGAPNSTPVDRRDATFLYDGDSKSGGSAQRHDGRIRSMQVLLGRALIDRYDAAPLLVRPPGHVKRSREKDFASFWQSGLKRETGNFWAAE